MGTEPKRHHFLPLFYLNNFAMIDSGLRNPKVNVLEKASEPRQFRTATINTGCVTDYHKLDNDIEDPMFIEKALSEIESRQALVVKRVLYSKEIEEIILPEFLEFMALQRIRVPKYKEMVRRFLSDKVYSELEEAQSRGLLPVPPDAIHESISHDGLRKALRINISNWKLLEFMLDPKVIEGPVSLFGQMHIALVCNKSSIPFISSDSPVSVFSPEYGTRGGIGWTYFELSTEFTLPLSPEICVRLSWKNPEKRVDADESLVIEYNRRTIISSDKHIYCKNIWPHLLVEVKNNCTKCSGFDFSSKNIANGIDAFSSFIPIE